MGFIYKSLLMMELGIKPVWVFDGMAPDQKKKELARRRQMKNQAKEPEEEAREVGNVQDQL